MNKLDKNRQPARAFYPFLIAVFPLFAMVSGHHAQLDSKEVIIAFGILLTTISIAWLPLRVLLPDQHQRAILLGLLAIAIWVVAPLLDWIRAVSGNSSTLKNLPASVLLMTPIVIAITTIILLRRTKADFRILTRIANIMMASIMAISLLSTLISIGRTSLQHSMTTPDEIQSSIDLESAPDIIVIVADMYGRHDALQQFYDFDNLPFIEALEDRGFYVARESRANYNTTDLALPTLMNFDYIASLTDIESGTVPYSTFMQNNRAIQKLKQYGYEFTAYATGIETTEMRDADHYLEPPENLSEFAAVLINKTPARFIFNRMRSYRERSHNRHYNLFDIHRNRILYTFQGLNNFTRGDVPQIVFAHVLIPHDPFVFDADLNPVYPPLEYFLSPEETMPDANIQLYIQGYRNQVQAFNSLALEAVDSILNKYPNTVILILGDHGPRLNSAITKRNEVWTSHIDEEMGILNAYYLPGVDYTEVLYPSISPVNSFRVVFNEYFDENLELVEDLSYFSDLRNDKWHDVTDLFQPKPVGNADTSDRSGNGTRSEAQ